MKQIKLPRQNWMIFLFYWLVTFLFYLPAMRAGKVGDYYRDWLAKIEYQSFATYVNRPGTGSLYQFTQLFTYVFYKLFGAAPVPWHFLHLTMHVLCGVALYIFFERLLAHAHILRARSIAFFSALLFCLSAYTTEVVVHEPCFHYSLSFLMVLVILVLLQKFLVVPSNKYLVLAVLIYLVSSFSLEVFYLTPFLGMLLATYYCFILKYPRKLFYKITLAFFVPALLIFTAHFAIIKASTGLSIDKVLIGYSTAHGIDTANAVTSFLTKFPKYVFNIALLGRFWPHNVKEDTYQFFESANAQAAFYGFLLLLLAAVVICKRKNPTTWKLLLMICIYVLAFTALVTTREFYGLQWVVYDRYTYFIIPFLYLAMILAFYSLRYYKLLMVGIVIFLCVNTYFLLKVNLLWYQSEKVVRGLINKFPNPGNKTTLLLNLPENMNGVLMIGAHKEGAFKLMYNMEQDDTLSAKVYDVLSFNMQSANDGAHVKVQNDSTLHVTLNQWGTWWWFHYLGATPYENEDYRVSFGDVGHWYELTLKKPADQYLLLYSIGDRWRIVDMNNKAEEQH